MGLGINRVRDETGGIRAGVGCDQVELSFTPPPPPHAPGGEGGGGVCVYGAVSHVGKPVPGDAGHQRDEKIIAPSVRARGDKV